MANASQMVPFFKKWEGGYANHPADKGGCTCSGVTIGTFQKYFGSDKTCEDLKEISDADWLKVFKSGYYDKVKADKIENQSLALLIVDFAWGSGPTTAIKRIQAVIGADVDGIVGKQTLGILNADPKRWFALIWKARYQFFINIVNKNPSQRVFLKGWLNRLNSIRYIAQ